MLLLVPEPEVPVEFIVPEPEVPEVVPVPVALLVPVVFALLVESSACTTAKTLAIEKAARAVVITAFDTFMINLLEMSLSMPGWHTTYLA
mgnify:CR=1 FL=1